MFWILPLILGLVLAVINYFLMAAGGDMYSQHFKIAVVLDLVAAIVYLVMTQSKISETRHNLYIAYLVFVCAVVLIISYIFGTKKFREKFDKESYTVEAVLHKHINDEWKFGKNYKSYFFDLKFRDKSGKEVFKEREVDFLIYDEYKDGDTIMIKLSDKYPEFIEVIDNKNGTD